MGYCQGLNFIAAAILLKTNEETTYQILCYILHTRGHHLLLADVGSVRINLYILDSNESLIQNFSKTNSNSSTTSQSRTKSNQCSTQLHGLLHCTVEICPSNIV